MPIRRRTLIALLIVIVSLPLSAAAAADPVYPVIGHGFTGRPIVLRDDIVLETDGLMEAVRDFSDPKSPAWVGWNDHSFTLTWRNTLVDGGLVVAMNEDPTQGPVGFSLTDFSQPEAPAELGFVTLNACESGWLSGTALVVALENLILAYDLADPAAPAITVGFPIGHHAGHRWPTAIGDRLFLLDGDSSVRVLDVGDPLHPVDEGALPAIPERIDALAASAGALHLLVAGDNGSPYVDLVTWEVSGAAAIETGRHRLSTTAGATGRALVAADDLLLAAVDDGRVQAFGLATPTSPEPGWSLAHDATYVAISRSAVFVTAGDELFVYGRTPFDRAPEDPVRRSVLPRLRTVVGDGPVQIAQRNDEPSILLPVDVTDPTHPSLGEPIDTGLTGTLSWADGFGLMVRDATALQLLDLTNPREPVPAGTIARTDPNSYATLHAGGIVLDRREQGSVLDLHDVRDPQHPRLAATLQDFLPIYCDQDWLVCGGSATYPPRLYRLDEDLRPQLKGHLSTQLKSTSRSVVLGQYVYLFGYAYDGTTREMEVHRIGDPSDLLSKTVIDETPHRVDVAGDQLFIQGNYECLVYDVSDPARPRSMGRFATPVQTNGGGFATNGEVVTVAAGLATVRLDAGLTSGVPTLPTAAAVRLHPARPNPFNPRTTISFSVDRERDLTVSVYDARGRLIDELARGRFPAGEHVLQWEARSGGAAVASGVYFVRVSGPGVETAQRLTLLK